MSRRSAYFALLILVPIVAYSSAFSNGFVWDDHRVIEKGQLIHSLKNIPVLFYHDAQFNSLGEAYAKRASLDTYRPVTLATFFVEYAAWGLHPLGYHLVNILIHVGCVLLLYWVALIFGATPQSALLGALLFAVHPSISEAIHWINGRSDPLGLLFFLLGLGLWLVGRWWGAIPCWVLSTMCKETSFILIGTLPILFHYMKTRYGARLTPWLSVGFAIVLGFGFRLFGLKRPALSNGGGHLWYALERVPAVWLDGFISLVRPRAEMPPSPYERYLHSSISHLALASALILVGFIWFWRRRRREPVGLWFFLTTLGLLAPVALLDEGWFGWGRYLYAAAALFALWVSIELAHNHFLGELLERKTVRATLALVFALMALQTFMAGHDWKTDKTFAEGILLDHPEQSIGYAEVAMVELREGHLDRAVPLLEKAIAIQPNSYFHWSRLADVLMKLGRPQNAMVAAQKTLRIAPRDVAARVIVAIGLLGQMQDVPAAQMLLGAILDDLDQQEGYWTLLQQALLRKGANSAFTTEVSRMIAEPRFTPIRARAEALLHSTFPP